LEGFISTTVTAPEGPFGEMHGYVFPGDTHPWPSFKVNAVTYRNDAILPVSNCGRITDETHTMIGPLAAASIRTVLRDAGIPVLEAHSPFESTVTWVVIQMDMAKVREFKWDAKTLMKKIGDLIFHDKTGFTIHRLVLVGEDIDIFNWNDVMWAFTTRCRPGDDEVHYSDVPGFILIPYMGHGDLNPLKGGKVLSNALMPSEFKGGRDWQAASFKQSYPEELQQKVLSRWESFGFKAIE
jgi:UbiD family decarboxylase